MRPLYRIYRLEFQLPFVTFLQQLGGPGKCAEDYIRINLNVNTL